MRSHVSSCLILSHSSALLLAEPPRLCTEFWACESSPQPRIPWPSHILIPAEPRRRQHQPCCRLGDTAPLQHSPAIDPPFANKQLPLWALIKMDRGLFKCPPFPAVRAGCTLLSNRWCGEELDRYLLHSCDTSRHQPESAQCQQRL